MAGHERKKHLIDGKEMTAPEIAAMLGISEQALRFRHSQMNLCSYQLIVDMYREGKMMTNHDRWPRHLVHGRWITVQQAADELGVRAHSINTWRCKNRDRDGNRPTLEEAYEHFRNAPKRGRGNAIPKVHTVMGRKMTVKQAAERYNTTEKSLWLLMEAHHISLEAAVLRQQEYRKKKAVSSIMSILFE